MKMWDKAHEKYELLRTELIRKAPAADRTILTALVPSPTVKQIIKHMLDSYKEAARTDTTLLLACQAPCDVTIPASVVLTGLDYDMNQVDEHQRRPFDTNNAYTDLFLGKYPAEIANHVRAALDVNPDYASLVTRELRTPEFRAVVLALLEAKRVQYVNAHGAANMMDTMDTGNAHAANTTDCFAHGRGCGHATKDCQWIKKYEGFKVLYNKPLDAKHTVHHGGETHVVSVGFLKSEDPVTKVKKTTYAQRKKAASKKAKADAATSEGK
jgi:hypothetical protein